MIQCRRGRRTVVEEWQDIVYKTTVYVLIGFSGKLYDCRLLKTTIIITRAQSVVSYLSMAE